MDASASVRVKEHMSKQAFYATEGARSGDFSVQAGEPKTLPNIVTVAQLPSDGLANLQDTVNYVPPADIALPLPVKGRKDDSGKVRMELLMDLSRAYEGVGQVLTWAVTDKKPVPYVPGSWQGVEDFHNRYMGALMRHLNNIHRNGRFAVDKETGILDLKHLATDAFFLAEMAQRELDKLQSIADYSARVPNSTDNPVNQA